MQLSPRVRAATRGSSASSLVARFPFVLPLFFFSFSFLSVSISLSLSHSPAEPHRATCRTAQLEDAISSLHRQHRRAFPRPHHTHRALMKPACETSAGGPFVGGRRKGQPENPDYRCTMYDNKTVPRSHRGTLGRNKITGGR